MPLIDVTLRIGGEGLVTSPVISLPWRPRSGGHGGCPMTRDLKVIVLTVVD